MTWEVTLWGQSRILASRLHIFIKMFVTFACFGCVVINHQKEREIVRKMDLDPFNILILVFDEQHNLWIMYLLVFVSVVHRMLKWLWTKALRKQHLKRRHYEDHK
jgi:hypothetical protein